MAKVTIHIGYPKCLSTTLQRDFFAKHPDINFGGIGVNDNISYASEPIEFLFEILLKYARKDFYEAYKKEIKKSIDKYLNNNALNIFSSEHLVMNFTLQGIDPDDKFSRLKEIFSEHDVSILVIHRNKDDFLKSLYSEFIKMGYYKTFDEFCLWIEKFKDRNFYYDLYTLNVQKKLEKYFSKIYYLKFENIIEDAQRRLNKNLSSILNIRNMDITIGNKNPSIPFEEIERLRKYNIINRRELGEDALTPFEHHRNRTLFKRLNLHMSENDIFANVLKKREALKNIKKISKNA